MFSLNIS